MTTLRTAAQQALEALDWYAECAMVSDKAADAASALRAALAEPNRAQKTRDAGYTRRPTLREMAEPEQQTANQELLEALKRLHDATWLVSRGHYNEELHDIAVSKARAVIAKVEEQEP
jgi:hypothetical protein